jgi:hypothetical protein
MFSTFLKELVMFESKITRDQKSLRTRIDDLPGVGEDVSPEQLRSVVGGLAIAGGSLGGVSAVGGLRISGPTCCSTCSCEYDDQGCGY